MDRVLKWEATRGSLMTVKMIKLIRLHVTRYLCGEPLLQSNDCGVGINKQGLPKALGPLLEFVSRDQPSSTLRILMTLLMVSRIIEARGKVDYSSITQGGPEVSGALLSEYREVITDLNLKLDRPQWTTSHLSTKAGPNAQAMVGSITDLFHLPESLVEALSVVGGPSLQVRINLLRGNFSLSSWNERFKIKDKSLIRKLSIVHDREGKERVIAIFDYWSQTALKPLHDILMDTVSSFKGDCTYDQQSSSRWLKVPGPYYSLDLTAATDRFPISIQEAVLAEVIDPEYAENWRRVMVDYEFKVPNESRAVKYGAGQGMGAYSSWATFALCHHLTVRVAAKRAGYTARWSNYSLLGDDIVLTNPRVVQEYRAIMREVGVDINSSKTHTSLTMYEFAKRWYRSGEEISGFPLGSLNDTKLKWFDIAMALEEGLARWSLSPRDVETRAYAEFLSSLGARLRDLDKMRTLWSLPKKGDSPETLRDKSHRLITRHFQDSVL